MTTAALLLALALLPGAPVSAQDALALLGTDGARHVVSTVPEGKRLRAFVFVTNDCPISNAYAPELNRLASHYGRKGVEFALVHVDRTLPPAEAAAHAKAYGFACPVLMDPGHLLVKRLGATVTPEAAVVDAQGALLYRGRVDDRYADFGKLRPPRTRDLRDALDAALAGKPVPAPRTKAIGCLIPKAA